MFTLCILNFVYSVFHVIFLPIPCLHNVVLCLLCVPLATSVYSILSFMLYFCHSSHCIYSFTVFTLCTHSCITRAYQYQSKKKKYIYIPLLGLSRYGYYNYGLSHRYPQGKKQWDKICCNTVPVLQ